jgi:hypothetical protein
LTQEDKLKAPKLSPGDAQLLRDYGTAHAEALKNGDKETAQEMQDKIDEIGSRVTPSLSPTPVLAPTPVATTDATNFQPVAAPMGTSGYVDYTRPISEQRGISYIGPALSPAAEATKFRRGVQPDDGIPATPDDMSMAPVGAPALMPAAPVLRPSAVTQENAGILGRAAAGISDAAKSAVSTPSMELFLHGDNPQHLRAYVASHPDLAPADKAALLSEATKYANVPALHPLQNLRTTGQLAKDFLFGTSEAALPLPKKSERMTPEQKVAAAQTVSQQNPGWTKQQVIDYVNSQ